jgi:hypothetical protein
LTPVASGDRIVSVTAVEKLAPEEYLARRVDEHDGHRLELHCGCGAKTFYPFKLLAKTCGQQCGGRPVRVAVTNFPARGMPFPDAWSVTLIDATAG